MTTTKPVRHGLLLFGLALGTRAAAWLGGGDGGAPSTANYLGDAPVWQRYAHDHLRSIEWLLPFRPPAMAWLTDALSDGQSFWLLRGLLVVLGALVAPLCYRALRAIVTARIAVTAGAIVAVSSSLVQLGNGVHSEIPYLFLFALSVGDVDRLRTAPTATVAARWGVLQAAACLFRVDHLAFVGLQIGWIALRRWPSWPRTIGVALGALAITLAPWQWHADKQIHVANTRGFPGNEPPPLPLPGALPWDPAAVRALAEVPAFARLMTFRFVDDTMRARGAARVRAADLAVVREAYDAMPEPLATPLLVLYGPLNFFLANSPESTGGFTRAALDRLPPLAEGSAIWPPGIDEALPRGGDLVLEYPPHLAAVEHGYRLGLTWMASHPLAAARLIGAKLLLAWRGAATGIGSYNLPMGTAAVREPVDLATADGPAAPFWRLALLLLDGCGLWRARSTRGASPWCCWLGAKAVTGSLFFGYARLGALCVPSL
ncbi:MAG TPA: phospholipid carrier-dependent glycosyltransferase, partial [bacterium]|nr:phospholipid carrier-dependent glycosyltransferase [bacterium]